jgi:hypothetical protein
LPTHEMKNLRVWVGGVGLIIVACSGKQIVAEDGGVRRAEGGGGTVGRAGASGTTGSGGTHATGRGCSFLDNGAGGYPNCDYTSQTGDAPSAVELLM